jgi:glycosyltransferase involved in cell wall biosynthesis
MNLTDRLNVDSPSFPVKPMISVVMPLLNAARHLQRSLGSLAEQRCRHFEVVLVDGGSSDGTLALGTALLSAASICHRIKLLPGSSIYEAMNCGVELAVGDWTYFMGSDDRLLADDVFERIMPYLHDAQPGILVLHGDVWIEDPGYRYGQRWDLPRLLDRNISHQSAFYRRKAINSLQIKYNTRYVLYADWDYNLKLLSKGQFQYVPLPVASYACTGASSQRVDECFLAEMEMNALQYFGWRACFLIPPYRFALGCGQRPSLGRAMQLQANRLIWILKRFRLKTARTKQQ